MNKTTTREQSPGTGKLTPVTREKPVNGVARVMTEIINTRNYIVEELSATFEKKLEKIDDAVIELISSKTENERLKSKIDNLTKENYRLKKELECYKPVVPGLFVKINKDRINL